MAASPRSIRAMPGATRSAWPRTPSTRWAGTTATRSAAASRRAASVGAAEDPRRDRLQDLRHLADGGFQRDGDARMRCADGIQDAREVLLEVPALPHEEREDGDRG